MSPGTTVSTLPRKIRELMQLKPSLEALTADMPPGHRVEVSKRDVNHLLLGLFAVMRGGALLLYVCWLLNYSPLLLQHSIACPAFLCEQYRRVVAFRHSVAALQSITPRDAGHPICAGSAINHHKELPPLVYVSKQFWTENGAEATDRGADPPQQQLLKSWCRCYK